MTTRWNASKHASGETMIEEILDVGIRHIELGYDTRRDLLPGVVAMQEKGEIEINSVHNYCPVPMGVSRGHPELWTFAALDARTQEQAVQHTAATIQFAAEVGAKAVVIHCGYVSLKRTSSRDLMDMMAIHGRHTSRYEKGYLKMLAERDKRVKKHLQAVYQCIERLLPVCEQHQVMMGLENLPTYEATPNEPEMEGMLRHFNFSPWLKYWHDLGHGQVRENMGFINHERWLEKLLPHTAGMHVHDVANNFQDHVMPPQGDHGLERFKPYAQREDLLLVLEPSSRATSEDVKGALEYLNREWVDEASPVEDTTETP